MIDTTFGFLLAALGLLALSLQRFYSSVPAHELKRLAARGDHLAHKLYRPVAYGASLRLFLWLVVGLSLGGSFVLLALGLQTVLAFVVVAVLLMVAFVVVQPLRLTARMASFTAFFSPAIAWCLHYTHRLFQLVARGVYRYREVGVHSGLYEKEDLLAMLTVQKEQHGNRIAKADLERVERVLKSTETKAADILLPRKQLRLVDANESVGPVLLDELHDSKEMSFLVYEDKPENVVGTLLLTDAVKAKQGGRVMDLTRHDLCYVHEDFTLAHALDALLVTRQQLAVVINAFEECVGVISLDRLMGELLGERAETTENFENREAVAAYKPVQAEVAAEPVEATDGAEDEPADSSPEVTEVVE